MFATVAIHAPRNSRTSGGGTHPSSAGGQGADSVADTRGFHDHYRKVWKEAHPGEKLPKLGLTRFVVVAETDTGVVLLLGPEAIDACAGSIDRLVDSIERAAEAAGIRWPNQASKS